MRKGIHLALGMIVLEQLQNGGSYVLLTYDTDFTDGRATETFHWRIANGRVRLVAYNINSPLLITR